MTTKKNDDKPDCFGKLYDEKDCSDCVLANECKTKINPKPVIQVADDEDLEALAAAALAEEEGQTDDGDKEDEIIELESVATQETDADNEPVKKFNEPVKKAEAEVKPSPKKKPAKKKKAVEVKNRKPFKELMEGGKITPLVDEKKKKIYMQVDDDGIHVYKSQIYHEKNLAEFADSGANPFKDGSIPAEAFNFLKKGDEVTFRDAFNHLKVTFPGKKDATLMNRAADVLSGAHFFGIAKVTRKEGRQKFFQMQ